MIRTAIIGVSGFADVHYKDLLREVENGRMKAVGATVRRQEKESEKCGKLRSLGCKIFKSHDEMLRELKNGLDLCMIPTGIHLHAPMSIAAMRAGADVFVEKPAAALYSDVLAMRKVERETGRFVAVGYQDMYGDEIHAVKKAVIDGRIGRVRSIQGMGLWPRFDSYYARNPWAGRIKVGGDMVLDSPFNNALAHYLNLMLFFAGEDERSACMPASVTAELFRAHDIESCDTACLRIETETGIPLYFFATHCSETTFGPFIRIKGEKGVLEWQRTKPSRIQLEDGRSEDLIKDDPAALRGKVMDRVTARISDPDVFICDLEIAGMQTLCVNAAHRSSEIVTVPEAQIRRSPEADSIKTVIIGIDEVFHKAFEEGCMLNDMDVPWASGVKSIPIDTRCFRNPNP